jgi:arylsulfatase A-like enzyme
LATVCELTGQPLPAGLDSISFLPVLLGKTSEQKQHEYLYWEFYEQGSRQAVRFGPWKAIRQPMLNGRIELYNLANDLGETTNLAESEPDRVAQAARFMDQAHVPDPKWKVPAGR